MLPRVLFVSPRSEDAARLGRMLDGISLTLDHAGTLAEASLRLPASRCTVVLTESVLSDGTWLDVLDLVRREMPAAELIVTRPVVDDRFWAEVLNLGAYDMLAQPFSESEVRRVLSSACARAVERAAVPAA